MQLGLQEEAALTPQVPAQLAALQIELTVTAFLFLETSSLIEWFDISHW
jgi:hypothetical protein